MYHGAIITSTIPHGRVRRIETERALSIDGVKAVVTCFDDKTIWNAGERDHERYVFSEKVRFVGDCIGAVVATTRRSAIEAAKAIRVEYEEIPAVLNAEDSARDGAPKIWENGNITGPSTDGFGDLDRAFHNADIVLERQYRTSRAHSTPLEPATSLAWWDGQHLTVVAGTQSIHGCRAGLALDLGLPKEMVRVITRYKGGGFGNKANSMNYDLVAAILSKKVGHPVSVEYSRKDDFVNVHGRWSTVQHWRVAVRRTDERLLAMSVKGISDVGAYSRRPKSLPFMRNPYAYLAMDAYDCFEYGAYTNTPATGNMRAPGGPESCFGSESLVDESAYRLGVDPLEFRLKNSIVAHPGNISLTSNGLKDCLALGAEAIGWTQKWHPPNGKVEGNDKLVGIGVAVAGWHSLLGKGEAIVRAHDDGTIEVCVGVVDVGTGAKTTMACIAADVFGMSPDRIKVSYGDTDNCPESIGEAGSTMTNFTGSAVREAAFKVRNRIISTAAAQFHEYQRNIGLRDGWVTVKGTDQTKIENILVKERIALFEEKAITDFVLPDHTERNSYAAHFAEVEVDMETGKISVTNYVAAHDSGQIVNRLTAESQVQGSVVMGLGMALSERVMIDPESGSVQNPSLLRYHLLNHTEIPRINVIFTDTYDPFGPKSLGEIGIVPVPAVVGNAIFNSTGVRLCELPFTREALLKALQSRD